MVKGWNRNRNWNNGWGCSRKNRNGNRDLKWVSHSTIETARRVLNAPTNEQRKATEGLVLIESERTGMGQTDETTKDTKLTVVVNIDYGYQFLVWNPEMDRDGLAEWFRGLSGGAMENLWVDPRTLPGRVEQLALARPVAPTHVLEIEGKKSMSLVEMKEGLPNRESLLVRDLYSKD